MQRAQTRTPKVTKQSKKPLQQQRRKPRQVTTKQLHTKLTSTTPTTSTTTSTTSTTIRSFASKPDLSHLKPLSPVATSVKQLDQINQRNKSSIFDKTLPPKDDKGDNDKDGKKRTKLPGEVDPPEKHLTRPSLSPYFLPMWDPEMRQNKELITSFENATSLPFDSMDLVGDSILPKANRKVNLREAMIQQNKITLVLMVSTAGPFDYAATCGELWAQEFAKHGKFNQDGAIIVEPILINISEGFFHGLFRSVVMKGLADSLGPHVPASALSLHIGNDDDAVSRARRFLDARDRFVVNLFLVDERGLIRWKGQLGAHPTKEFMDVLNGVTNDLILETKFDEADA